MDTIAYSRVSRGDDNSYFFSKFCFLALLMIRVSFQVRVRVRVRVSVMIMGYC